MAPCQWFFVIAVSGSSFTQTKERLVSRFTFTLKEIAWKQNSGWNQQ
jgi:hypothetical protein